MAAPIYLETLRALPTTAIFNNRRECERFTALVKVWKRDNPSVKAGSPQALIAERYIVLHVLIQRLMDRRYFWDGSETTFQSAGSAHEFTLSAECQARKDKEYWTHYPDLHRWQLDLLKLAMAASVNLNVTGDVGSIHSLFGAMDQMELRKVATYRNGNGSQETEITDLI